MKLSINFLKDYVDVPVDMVTLGEDMTNVGNEYDSAKKLVETNKIILSDETILDNYNENNSFYEELKEKYLQKNKD